MAFKKKVNISIVMPTCNRYEIALQNVANLLRQKQQQMEVIVCDDSDISYKTVHGKEFCRKINMMKASYIYCARFRADGTKEYGLARARNSGILESKGDVVVFLDDRITPVREDTICIMHKELMQRPRKTWVYGNKGSNKKVFVENFSAVRRADIIDAGMFCERIDQYGGATREIIARMTAQGFSFLYVTAAHARAICPSSGWDNKPRQIKAMEAVLEKMWGDNFSDHFPKLFRNSST